MPQIFSFSHPMQIAKTIPQLRQLLATHQRPAFVPTMGNLHEGHLSLIKQAKPLGDVTVASIFVNRLQFAPHEDFDTYPRTFAADCEKLQAAGCDVLFAPTERELYPEPQTYKIYPAPELADILEGFYRPGFFVGVCTVVFKLFACVFAGKAQGAAVFGQKDFQQLLVIQNMARQFALPIEIHAGSICRAPDGLALSSRNGYLSEHDRAQAVQLSQALQELAVSYEKNPLGLAEVELFAMKKLASQGWAPDYLTVRRQLDLQPPTGQGYEALVVLGAAKLGATRLIDNFLLSAQ